MQQKHCFSCEEIYYENIGRLLDRRDNLRQGYSSIYDDDVRCNDLHDGPPNPNAISTIAHSSPKARVEAVVPVVSSLPKWARGTSSKRSEGAGVYKFCYETFTLHRSLEVPQ